MSFHCSRNDTGRKRHHCLGERPDPQRIDSTSGSALLMGGNGAVPKEVINSEIYQVISYPVPVSFMYLTNPHNIHVRGVSSMSTHR